MASHPSRWLTLALCCGYFLVLLDVTVVNVALPQIGSGLLAGSAGLAGVADAYAIPLAALLLVSGRAGDLVGHRGVVLTGFAAFGAASVLCAMAPTIAVLIAARAVQGTGAALILPGTLALLVENAQDEAGRARVVGLWAAIGGAALPAGPVVGGMLVQLAGWRAVFWLAVPFIALAFLPVVRLPGAKGRFRPARDTGRASGSLPAERRAMKSFLPVPRAGRGPLGLACLVAGLMNMCALGGLFLLTQILQDAHRRDPIEAGLLTLPAMLPLPLLALPAGSLGARIGAWRTGALGLAVTAAGFGGVAATIAGPPHAGLPISLALWGSGLGILTPAIVAAALDAVPGSPGLASGASNTSRQAGGALGIALFAAIAGSASEPGFLGRSAWLFLGAAALFVFGGVLCLGSGRTRLSRDPGRR